MPTGREPNLKALLLAAGLLLGGCAHTLSVEGAQTVVPYELQKSGRILVDVQINDRGPLTFVLDTAASISSIFDRARTELGLETLPNASANIYGVLASGSYPVVRIDSIQVGSEIWANARIVSLPGESDVASGISGILGIDFLRRYGVRFSTQDRALRLYLPERISESSYRGWASVPLEPRRIGQSGTPLYFFTVTIRGRSVPALFDLGAGLNMINAAGAQYLKLLPPGRNAEVLIADALKQAPILARMGAEEVRTASIRWRNEEFLIADLDIFSTLQYENSPLAIIGSGLFNQRDFVIDFVRNRLLVDVAMREVEQPPPAATAVPDDG